MATETKKPSVPYANVLRSIGGDGPDVDLAVEFVQGRRANRAESRELDRFFFEELAAGRLALAELRERQEDLRRKHRELIGLLDKLTAPPLFEAVYVEADVTSGRPLATVAHGGVRRLVEVHDDVDRARLAPGDTVFLNSELNAILVAAKNGVTRTGEIATVERWTPGGRLVIRDRDSEVVIDVAGGLRNATIEAGDQVVWSREVRMAFDPVPPSDTTPSFVRIEDLGNGTPQPLGGLDVEVRRIIALFTHGFRDPEIAVLYDVVRPNKSLLMVGPPGCGKTSIARRVAYEAAQATGRLVRFANVNGSELESPWVGETQRNVRDLFRVLNEYDGPTILHIDEIESIGRHRGSISGHHSDKFLSQWLTCLDGFSSRDGVAVIASTNRKDLIDGALLERISGTEVRIGRPNIDAAREILGLYLPESIPYHTNGASETETRERLIDLAVARLYDPNAGTEVAVVRFRDGKARTVRARELVSGRLCEQICGAARQRASERHAAGGASGLCEDDLTVSVGEAVDKLATTLTVRNVGHFVTDLPQDVDVVAVEPVRRTVRSHRYLTS